MPDAYVTAHHLRDLLNEASLEPLAGHCTAGYCFPLLLR
jgi:hypothetical protein